MIRKVIRILIYLIFIFHWLKTCKLAHGFYSLINPFSSYTSSMILIEDVLFALVAVIIITLILLGSLRIDKKVMGVLLLFFASGLILLAYSFLIGNHNLLANFRLYAFCFLGIAFWFSFAEPGHLLNLIRLIVVIFCIDTCAAIVYNINSLYVTKVYLNEALIPFGVILSVMVLKCRRHFPFLYFVVLCSLPLAFLNILLAGSRSTYLYIALFIILMIIINFKKIQSIFLNLNKFLKLTTIVVLILITTSFFGSIINFNFQKQFKNNILKAYHIQGSAYARIVAWSILLERISEKPFLGYGLGAGGSGINIRISDGINPNREGILLGSAHNAMLILMYQIGSIGIFIMGLFLYRILRLLMKARKYLSDDFKLLSNIMIAGTIAFLFEISFHPLSHNFYYYLWYYLGIVIAIIKISRGRIRMVHRVQSAPSK